MNLLEMYKQLSDEEKQEFISFIIEEINKSKRILGNFKINENDLKIDKTGLIHIKN